MTTDFLGEAVLVMRARGGIAYANHGPVYSYRYFVMSWIGGFEAQVTFFLCLEWSLQNLISATRTGEGGRKRTISQSASTQTAPAYYAPEATPLSTRPQICPPRPNQGIKSRSCKKYL